MNYKEKGLLNKYILHRSDGKQLPSTFDAFVLRLDEERSDKVDLEACRKAILTYAEEIKDYLPNLSLDLIKKYSKT